MYSLQRVYREYQLFPAYRHLNFKSTYLRAPEELDGSMDIATSLLWVYKSIGHFKSGVERLHIKKDRPAFIFPLKVFCASSDPETLT